jgi:hypothetical protein
MDLRKRLSPRAARSYQSDSRVNRSEAIAHDRAQSHVQLAQGLAAEAALAAGMAEKSKEFAEVGAEVYVKS